VHVDRLEVVVWHVAEHPPELGGSGCVGAMGLNHGVMV
jgi:hypothetical protein